MPMPQSGAARPSRSESNMRAGVAAGFEALDHAADRAHGLDQAPEGAEQAEEHQQAGHVARDVARLVEAGGDRVENAAHQLRRHRHAADAAAEDRRHRRQQHRRPLDREAGIGEAEIVDPGDLRDRAASPGAGDSTMPMSSTPMISALRPGLAMNATSICLCSRKATRPPSMTNTSIRNRKMRGDDSLSGSSSFAMCSES